MCSMNRAQDMNTVHRSPGSKRHHMTFLMCMYYDCVGVTREGRNMCMYHGPGWRSRVRSLLLSLQGSQGSNPGHQACKEAPLPPESPHQPLFIFMFIFRLGWCMGKSERSFGPSVLTFYRGELNLGPPACPRPMAVGPAAFSTPHPRDLPKLPEDSNPTLEISA